MDLFTLAFAGLNFLAATLNLLNWRCNLRSAGDNAANARKNAENATTNLANAQAVREQARQLQELLAVEGRPAWMVGIPSEAIGWYSGGSEVGNPLFKTKERSAEST